MPEILLKALQMIIDEQTNHMNIMIFFMNPEDGGKFDAGDQLHLWRITPYPVRCLVQACRRVVIRQCNGL